MDIDIDIAPQDRPENNYYLLTPIKNSSSSHGRLDKWTDSGATLVFLPGKVSVGTLVPA